MQTAPLPAEPTKTPQGGGARFFRRLGGAVRGAISGGIALLHKSRGKAAPKPTRKPAAPKDPAASSAPRQKRAPRPPSAGITAAAPKRQGWFARWFAPKRQQPELPAGAEKPARQPRRARRKDPLFTPATHPGLTQEDCDFLNTPLGKCDPAKVRILADALSRQIAAAMGPDFGMDGDALFATFCERLLLPPDQAGPTAPPEEQPPPAAPNDAAPDAPPAPPAPLQEPGSPPENTAPGTKRPAAPLATQPIPLTTGSPFDRHPAYRHARRSLAGSARARSHRSLRSGSHRLAPPRRLCYAACAGPP